jgi:flagellar protein FliO/FliZ
MASGFTALLWFLAIIALIPVALWLLKRTPVGGTGTAGLMRTVAVLPVAPGQRLLTVEVGSGAERKWLVLGVTGQHITALHTMAPQAEVPAGNPASGTPFAQLMHRLTGVTGVNGKGPQP